MKNMLISNQFCLFWSLNLCASPICSDIDKNQVQVGTPYCFFRILNALLIDNLVGVLFHENNYIHVKKRKKKGIRYYFLNDGQSSKRELTRFEWNYTRIAFEWLGHLVLVSHSSYYYGIAWISWNWPYLVKERLYTVHKSELLLLFIEKEKRIESTWTMYIRLFLWHEFR